MPSSAARTFRYKEIKASLLELIDAGEMKRGDALWGERELCERFDASRNTVRQALKELEDEGVLESVAGRGTFIKKLSAKKLNVAVVVPALDYFYPSVLKGLEATLKPAGLRIVAASGGMDPESELKEIKKLLEDPGVGAFAIAPSNKCRFEELLKLLKGRQAVLMDHAPECLEADCVVVDHFKGGYEATKKLVELGHRRIACAGHPGSSTEINAERTLGYAKALAEAEASYDSELVRRGKWFESCPLSEFEEFFKREDAPTAIFCGNDRTASVVLARLRDCGLRPGEDVAVQGYDDEPYAELLRPALSSVSVPKEEMGVQAAKLLLRRLKGPPLQAKERVVLKPTLVLRESTGLAKRRS